VKKVFLVVTLLMLTLISVLAASVFLGLPEQQHYSSYSMPNDVTTLDQNWSDDIRQQVNFTSFGSRLIPYEWFLYLELAGRSEYFRSDESVKKMGFVPQQVSESNPNGLPIGFAKDLDETGQEWVGFSCSSCHSRQLTYQDHTLFIDGGPGLLNFPLFEKTIYRALLAVRDNQEKQQLFIERIQLADSDYEQFIAMLNERIGFLERRFATNVSELPYGYGRMDGLGLIFNTIATVGLGMPDNFRVIDAPVNMPVLWDAPHQDQVQWNGSVPNMEPGPLLQNSATALVAYGNINILSEGLGYESTIPIKNLGYVQQHYYDLKSPPWPENILGALDKNKLSEGKKLYQANCIGCHAVLDRAVDDHKTEVKIIALDEIGTDPKMAENFVNFMSDTGSLEKEKMLLVAGQGFGKKAHAFEILTNAVVGSLLRQPLNTVTAIVSEYADPGRGEVNLERLAYKARPLNGVWASAPYLHNGSVPSLYDLLSSPNDRPKAFYVGSTEINPTKVGLVTDQVEYSTLFDTSLLGNFNTGHEFGTSLSDAQKWALVEYLKSL